MQAIKKKPVYRIIVVLYTISTNLYTISTTVSMSVVITQLFLKYSWSHVLRCKCSCILLQFLARSLSHARYITRTAKRPDVYICTTEVLSTRQDDEQTPRSQLRTDGKTGTRQTLLRCSESSRRDAAFSDVSVFPIQQRRTIERQCKSREASMRFPSCKRLCRFPH